MTTSATELIVLNETLERSATATKCPCGGYAEEVAPTQAEIKEYQRCGRSYACCIAAFVCCLCQKRLIAHLHAPEME